MGLALWSWLARRPAVYGMMTALGARVLSLLGGADRRIRRLPLGGGWTKGRDLPAPQGKTFRELYRSKR